MSNMNFKKEEKSVGNKSQTFKIIHSCRHLDAFDGICSFTDMFFDHKSEHFHT